jgi:hypothetical protein
MIIGAIYQRATHIPERLSYDRFFNVKVSLHNLGIRGLLCQEVAGTLKQV